MTPLSSPDCVLSREPPRAPGAQQHHRPGAAAHQELSSRHRQDPEGGGKALSPGQRHRL